jgi:putative membrane protein
MGCRREDVADGEREMVALSIVVCSAYLYALGRRGAAGGRARREGRWRAQAFYGGLLALALATLPPLDSLADQLFWAHMLQHLLLQTVAPPLIVLGAPWLPIWRLLPLELRRPLAQRLARSRPLHALAAALAAPPVAWLLFIGLIALSHLPQLFDFALQNKPFHESEHLLFLALGLLFWTRVLDSPPFRARLNGARRVAFLAAATAAEWLLALVILAARTPLYSGYSKLLPRPEHLSAIADQQFGAGIMLDPFSPLAFATLWALKTWLQRDHPAPAPTLV